MISRAEFTSVLLAIAFIITNWHHLEESWAQWTAPPPIVVDVHITIPGNVPVNASWEAVPEPAHFEQMPALVPVPAIQIAPAIEIPPTMMPPTPMPPPVFSELVPAPVAPVCSCAADAYNCSDFASKPEAEACFNLCIRNGSGDIHGLDGDHDGMVCESQF